MSYLTGAHFHAERLRFSYLIDGCVLFPIAKRLRGYSTPHRLPVHLRPGKAKLKIPVVGSGRTVKLVPPRTTNSDADSCA
jgi:hypothetical protein